MKIHNNPDGYKPYVQEQYRSDSAGKDAFFNPGKSYVKNSYMGNDMLQLSEDYSYSYSAESYGYNYNYSNFLRLVFIFLALFSIAAVLITVMVVVGGLLFVIVFFLIVLLAIFLASLNLNPFSSTTYKKIAKSMK